MRHLFITILIILPIKFCFGQDDNCSHKLAKGFIVRAFAKDEVISFFSKNRDGIPIDVKEKILFIPIDSITDDFDIKEKIQEKINKEFYTFSPYQWETTNLKKCSNTAMLRSLLSKLDVKTKLKDSKTYYKIRGRKHKHKLYTIHYIEGEWLQVKYNPKANELSTNFKIELINMNISEIKLYYLLKYSKFEEYCGSKLKSLKLFKW